MALVHPGAPSALDLSSPAMICSSENNSISMAVLQTLPAGSGPGIQTPRPPHRQIHRNRASYSCHSCRRRKVKCDRQHPTCGNCSKMAEPCVYSDNTGKGAKNKNKDRQAASSSSASSSSSSTEITGLSPKRLRTNSGVSVSVSTSGSDDDSCSYRSHSRSSSMNQSDFNALNSPFQSPDQLPMSLPPPPPPTSAPPASLLSTTIKEGELETRVNRLAEIVDQWYKVAYSHGQQPGSPPPGFNTEAVDGSNRRWSNTMQEHARPQGMTNRSKKQGSPEYTPRSSPVLGRARVQKSSAHGRPRSSTVSSTHFASCKDGGGEDVAMGHLSIQENGRSRYVGTSFWALLSNEITDLNQVLKSPNKEASCTNNAPVSTPPHSACTPPPEADGIFRAYGNIDSGKDILSILHSIPSRKRCEVLYRSFLDGVHPIMPLIHVPTFSSEWRSFWSWFPENTHTLPGGDLLDNPTFIPLLLAILYAGAASMSAKAISASFDGRSKEVVVNHLFAATTSALAATAFPRSPTTNSLIAFLIVQTCLIREEEPLTSCSFIGTAMRIAQQMGLHRDGSLFGLGEVECEVRRRVWWHIMHLDIQGAIATGLPPLGGSSEDQFDTKMVSELGDEFIGCEPSDSCDANRNSPAMILAVGRYETAQLLRKIIVRLLGIKPPRKADIAEMGQMIMGLKGKLEERIARIPARGLPEMGFIPHEEVDGAEREGIFNSWARIMLSMMSDRAYGVLYQPFLKSTKSKMWLHARHCALRSAHSFLRSYIHLSRSPLFAPYHWYCPVTYQPLHAIMILLLDLHERPLAPEAPRSRVFVDEIFSLFSDHPGEAWRLLGRLRHRAEMVAKNTTATNNNHSNNHSNNTNPNSNTWEGGEIGWDFGEWAATAPPAAAAAEEMQPQQQVVVMPDQHMDMMIMHEEFDWNSVFVEVDGSSPRTVGQVEQVDMNGAAAGWALLECDD